MRVFLLAVFLMLIQFSFAQRPSGSGGRGEAQFKGEVYGKVIDSVAQEPLEYVIVSLHQQSDTLPAIGTGITGMNGEFSVKVAQPGSYILKIDFFGFQKKLIPITLSEQTPTSNLKEVYLSNKALDEVEVIGDKPLVTYEIDKKVINVEDQNTNLGQTATEILANVPSVNVDIDGNVSLRGSTGFMVLINGVPSAMDPADALATIPASTIESIEIVTNPSAKYDAEGAVGLINIILKKKKLEGMSLLANVNAGNFNNYGGDVALSIGKESWTLNIGGNFNSRVRPRDIEKSWRTELDNTINYITSTGEGGWNNKTYGGNAEFQWNPNASHNLVIAGNYNMRLMRPEFLLQFSEYSNGVLQQSNENDQIMNIDVLGYSGSIFYQYNINRNPDHHITFKFLSNQRDVTQLDSTMFYDLEGNITGGTKYTEVGPADFNRFNLDYVHPFGVSRFETGLQVQLGQSGDDGKSFFWDTLTNQFEFSQQFSSLADYTRDIYAGYAIFNQKYEKFAYQLGLRAEYTDRTIFAENFPDSYTEIKRLDWFPSVHLSLNLSKNSQMLLNWARRIERPRSWYFEPFITWESQFNVRSGNTDLTPEYLNVFELSWVRQLGKKGFFSAESYYRYNRGLIERISTAYDENIVITKPYNIGFSNSAGLEVSLQYKVTSWYEVNAAANGFLYNVRGDITTQSFDGSAYTDSFDNSSLNSTFRLTNSFKYKNWSFQLVGRYTSPTATLQGSQEGFFVLDASVRTDFSDKRFSFTLQGNNLLGTEVNNVVIVTSNLSMIRNNVPQWPLVTLTFSMKLNNYKKILLKHEAADDF